MARHNLEAATSIICQGADLANPELWVARRLRAGIFPGLKIGRDWFMTDADIESAIQTCRRGCAPDPSQSVEEPAAAVSITDGISVRARRLRTA
jgi:hypothetical protein